MRKPQGYAVWLDPNGEKKERDTFTCSHCQHVVFVAPKEDPSSLGGHCRMCDKLICPSCVSTGKCDPFEKKLEAMERSERFRRAF